MLEVFTLYLRLVLLIAIKWLGLLLTKFTTCLSLLTWPALLTATATRYPIGVLLSTMKQLIFSLFSIPTPGNKDIKLGIAILTRFPIPERASVGESGILDNLQASLKNATLFERVIGEATVCTVITWLQRFKSIPILSQWSFKTQLYLVYRKNYTSAFSLCGWLSVIPNHLLARSTHTTTSMTNKENTGKANSPRDSDILSKARHNLHNRTTWEDPDVYCSSRTLSDAPVKNTCSMSTLYSVGSDCSETAVTSQAVTSPICPSVPIEYVTVEGLEFTGLLEVAVRVALRSECNYIIVLNPRALGLRPDHLSTALQLLTGYSFEQEHHKSVEINGIDVVLGMTMPSRYADRTVTPYSSPRGTFSPGSPFASPTGLYLLGLRGSRRLMLDVYKLTSSAEWATSTTATRIWANLVRSFPDWNVVCMRERLEEVMQPPDLLTLERHLGVQADHLMEDSITVIIPMGHGHVDDGIDVEEDAELIDVVSSKALAATVEVAVYNASGRRPIQIIIIVSTPETAGTTTAIGSAKRNAASDGPRFRSAHLRPMITVSVHHFNPLAAQQFEVSDPSGSVPRRGQLIRYAVEHLATGAMLVFVEPGIQLPLNWDSAVFHSLQRPGVGMGCFAYRLDLHDKYIHRKSLTWALNCWLANYVVNIQTRKTEIPIVGQPHFIYAHYLACLGGYTQSSRALHAIDLALLCHRHIGRVMVTRTHTAAAGVPANFALRHGAYRTAVYTTLLALARYMGATEQELARALSYDWRAPSHAARRPHPLPLIQPHYLDGY